ncbi:Zn-ribbon domain-containing OB-fold protein [Nocardia sp. CDC159]|uniref:Zn-ribbon domain-containing OB-fold protein n=1 Tax=Nocardia pulmonis TaxID=2951408 RepID=A0A9X2E285_9NOCA|nr:MULTISPECIES: Zn-ribbon domain-containing OB-fold protein [Nocardia]MCM6772902.1 Zn-ribbon domain-containing OB-fold protein [Nocardia pulmonis]MCM6785795.1 Zn-ribbon domain-containing OB-fold protein [Nocardia sp. CDC159]
MTGAIPDILAAELRMKFDYTRSVGPTIGRFLTGLRAGRIVGVRGSDGRVLVPPAEFDPVTSERLTEFVDVADVGTVRTWSWVRDPLPGQPFDRPFAWALIELDGADTGLLHAVDVASPDDIHTGMRVRARWAAERTGTIHDIACFEPGEISAAPAESAPGEPVTGIITPIDLRYKHTAAPQETVFLRAIAEGRLLGARAADGKVYFPPRGADPRTGEPTEDYVDLADTGIVTTFCIVNVPFQGQRIKPPYVAAYILLDGADIPFLHLVLGCDASEVRMGMRVKAVWKPRTEWTYDGLDNVAHFEPTGEPDAEYETFAHHL